MTGVQTCALPILYVYDSDGLPIGMQYHDATYADGVFDVYWYEKNLQGDIVAIYDEAGTKLLSYTYDAWGNATATSTTNNVLANNPFRYRGYYYDVDLGLYYLNARYYDSVIGRFVNTDDVSYLGADGTLNSYNLYAYCLNNPIKYKDSEGTDAVLITAYCRKGLPVVGHTALAFQYGDNWYITEYTGKTKASAKVKTRQICEKNEDPYEKINEYYGEYTDKDMGPDVNMFLILYMKTLNKIYSKKHYDSLYLTGDYSKCYDEAIKVEGSDLGGYNLITNNCGQYVNRILKHGDNSSGIINFYHKTSVTIVPVLLHLKTAAVNEIFGEKTIS